MYDRAKANITSELDLSSLGHKFMKRGEQIQHSWTDTEKKSFPSSKEFAFVLPKHAMLKALAKLAVLKLAMLELTMTVVMETPMREMMSTMS